MEAKKVTKVTHNGETKRFKVTSDFNELVNLTKNSFEQLPEPLKFFYMDEEQEVISVSCDQDLIELLNSDELSIVKLFVAPNQAEARVSMVESAHESESERIKREFSDIQSEIPFPKRDESIVFDKISHADLAVSREPSLVEEIQISAGLREGSQTERQMTSEIKMIDTAASTHEAQSEVAEKLVSAASEASEEDDVEMTFEQVQQQIREFWRTNARDMLIEHIEQKNASQKEVVHEGFACDTCSMAPIKGIRYKCSVCADYDICGTCEQAGEHSHHTMLKIRHPKQSPAKIICQYRARMNMQPTDTQLFSNVDLLSSLASLNLGNLMPSEPKRSQTDCSRFLARFVKESFSDKHEVTAGESFTKSWTFRNSGEVAWPADVIFTQTSGDEMEASIDAVKCSVQPGSSYTFTVTFKAPMLPGKYTSFFRLQSGNIKFGHKTWCDIMVVESEPEPKEQEVIQEPEPIESEPVPEIALEEEVKVQEVAEPEEEVKVQEIAVPEEEAVKVEEVLQVPNEYLEKVKKVDSSEQRDNLTYLYDLGFTSFETNKALLEKYQDINKVANILLSGALAESAVAAVYGGQEE